jgi:hypothetical protein
MRSHCAAFGLLAVAFVVPPCAPQSSVTTPPETPPGDRSFYVNQPVNYPEALSGVWQTPDGSGGAVGIHLELMTAVSGDADPPIWTPQSWQHLNLGIFQRKGSEIAFGDENYFSDSVRGGSVLLSNGRIQLHFVSTWRDMPSVDLDLLHQADGCWHGRFHRGSFDSVVPLCRPTSGSTIAPSPLIGTWSSGYGGGCIHIFETGPGTFTGWSDALEVPGQIVFGRNIPGPHQLYQNYGDLAKIHLANNGEVSLEFGAYNPMCCSHRFIGKLSTDGSTILGDFPPGPNQNPHTANWTKVQSDSCVDPTALQRVQPLACPPDKN